MLSIAPAFISTLDKVDTPVAVKSPLKVVVPDAANVVNAPVSAEFAPIAVLSIAPAFISTLEKVEVPVAVRSVRVDSPVTSKAPVTVANPVTARLSPTLKSSPI